MEYTIVEIKEFSIIGIGVRTINKDGKAGHDIMNLWERFMSENLMSKIPNRMGNEIYCFYTDFESDFRGEYLTILGCKVSSLENIPEGFIGKTIPKTKCRHYKVIGQIPQSVGIAWNEIWQSDIDRTYLADFDVYGEKSQQPENAEVDIYLSVR